MALTEGNRARLVALFMASTLSACSYLHPSTWFSKTPPPKASPQAQPTPEPMPEPQTLVIPPPPPPRRARPHPSAKPSPVLTLNPTGSLTDNGSDQHAAEQTIDHAQKMIAKVDRSRLTQDRIGDYDAVVGLISGAQEAVRESDFVRAESLAHKASLLATQLATPAQLWPSPHP
jgi:hypothetical protein